jgi:hypothetical protein
LWFASLTAAEIGALAKGARPIQARPAALKLWWPLDGYRAPAFDRMPLANHGNATGTALAAGPPLIAPTPFISPPPSPSAIMAFLQAPPSHISVSYQRAQQILMTGP